jgi:hypothetical protein
LLARPQEKKKNFSQKGRKENGRPELRVCGNGNGRAGVENEKLTMLAAVPNTFTSSSFIDGKAVSSGCGISNSLM